MYESIAKNLELKLKQNQSEIKDLQEKYNKECFIHQENLSLRNMFESQVKDLELEKEQHRSKFTYLKSQVTEMQNKFRKQAENLKENYESQLKDGEMKPYQSYDGVDREIKNGMFPDTVAIPKIISVKNARAWVSMVSYLEK